MTLYSVNSLPSWSPKLSQHSLFMDTTWEGCLYAIYYDSVVSNCC